MYTKEQQLGKRKSRKQKDKTRITAKVRKEVKRRSGGRCERCGITNPWMFQMAHLEQASHVGPGDDPTNIVLLCGPSVNTGTCHDFADSTKEGREWRKRKRQELIEFYQHEAGNS
ncbi:HNH endonuclease [Alkalibacillus salilacus]|uniref:Restriction endonuclease n=1 Tax=Alkalibacillus salilacus TaxID=284582 RepID=A0ABT9VDC7_9BACI|nr:HNH endonuclease [Alkalibacillus salilacus]MDQ0158981.1 putative restriction endonuclease [Alkalibacillus salilacus]